MKELQAGIQLVKTKYIELNRHPVSKKARQRERPAKASKPVTRLSQPEAGKGQQTEKPILRFPIRSSLEVPRRRTTSGVRRLENQAQHINQLSAELEAAVLELKAIASEINPDWKVIHGRQNICEYHAATVPQVESKQDGSFVLISKPVDLFQAEREATLLAQTLRHQAKKKLLRSQQ